MDIKNIQGGQTTAVALSTRVEASAQLPQVQQNETSYSNERSSKSVSESTDNQGNVIQFLIKTITFIIVTVLGLKLTFSLNIEVVQLHFVYI